MIEFDFESYILRFPFIITTMSTENMYIKKPSHKKEI